MGPMNSATALESSAALESIIAQNKIIMSNIATGEHSTGTKLNEPDDCGKWTTTCHSSG
jgi:hypothetical protein